jgi:hypothetical protein
VPNDPERDPFKVAVLAASVVTSPVIFVRFDWLAGTVLHSFPPFTARVFLGWLFACSVMSLYGIVRQRTVRGVLWERAGMYGIAALFVTYGTWAFAVVGGPATGFGSLLITLGFAAIVRIRQINSRRRKGVRRGPS